ncbi:MAG: 3-hydroxyacyl-ACP dehydratase FabZ, partial [Chloroflexi bacterium]|nr:3-hydroxyacyl-ACP dehydratase FabZ [Chloroflexota bacterium]
KHVSMGDPFLQGHFPEYPIMPGVLIVEALAQVGAVLVMRDAANAGKLPFFARIDNCRFRRPVRPGDTLRLELDVTSSRGPVGKAHARALVEGDLACEADLTFALGSAG